MTLIGASNVLTRTIHLHPVYLENSYLYIKPQFKYQHIHVDFPDSPSSPDRAPACDLLAA